MKSLSSISKNYTHYLNLVKKESNKSRLSIGLSMINSYFKFGASPANYQKFGFVNLTNKQRATFVTSKHNVQLIRKYNNSSKRKIFDNKVEFAKVFGPYMGREWIDPNTCSQDEWESFIVDKERVICKPTGGREGKGIQFIDPHSYEFADMKKSFANCIIEDLIKQNKKLDEVYDKAVNCLRVISVTTAGKTSILVANLTFGSEHGIVNASFGGITTEIDTKTGIVFSKGGGFDRRVYDKHPISGVEFEGYVVPYWDEVVQLVEKCAKLVPEVGYIGWDIAIAENGPVVIEGNTRPGYAYFQIPELLRKKGVGVLDVYKPFF